jgi:YbbR domain-containing protein
MAFRDYILDRFWLKLFAFILATLIWFTVSTQNGLPSIRNPLQSVETLEITRPVRLLVLPTTRRSFSIHPVEVRITVKGRPAALDRLGPTDIQAQVNLTDAVDSAASYFVEARNVPRTVEVVQIVPSWVMVEPRAN